LHASGFFQIRNLALKRVLEDWQRRFPAVGYAGLRLREHQPDVAVRVEFSHDVVPLVNARWTATGYTLPAVADAGPV
jgi:hypothetical protein